MLSGTLPVPGVGHPSTGGLAGAEFWKREAAPKFDTGMSCGGLSLVPLLSMTTLSPGS